MDAVCALGVAPVADAANAVEDMAVKMAVQEAEAREVLRARVNDPSVLLVIVLIHSDSPAHYTLLVRSRIAVGEYELRYFDSMQGASKSGIAKAQKFADECGWNSPVGAPVNKRFQES